MTTELGASHASQRAQGPHEDIVAEAGRLLTRADAAGVPVRLLGGVAIAARMPTGETPLISREYRDIDFITSKGARRVVDELMADTGYRANVGFNAVNGHRRLLYYDDANERQVDAFVNEFRMCHTIPIADRMFVDPLSIPLAELLLTKLQIVELNAKDHADIFTLMYHHAIGDADGATINGARIAEICAQDWGLWRTIGLNLTRSQEALASVGVAEQARPVLADRLADLTRRLDVARKSRKWKLRARVGDRVRWYEEPEEVD